MAELLDMDRELPSDVLRAFRHAERLSQAELGEKIADRQGREYGAKKIHDLEEDRITWRPHMIEDIARAMWQETEKWENMFGEQRSTYRQMLHQRTDKWTSRFAKAWEYSRSLTLARYESYIIWEARKNGRSALPLRLAED